MSDRLDRCNDLQKIGESNFYCDKYVDHPGEHAAVATWNDKNVNTSNLFVKVCGKCKK